MSQISVNTGINLYNSSESAGLSFVSLLNYHVSCAVLFDSQHRIGVSNSRHKPWWLKLRGEASLVAEAAGKIEAWQLQLFFACSVLSIL